MGTDFKCGCRLSGCGWYLCENHEADLVKLLIDYEHNQEMRRLTKEVIRLKNG